MSAPVKDMLVAPHDYFLAALALTSNIVIALTCIAFKVELLILLFSKSSQRSLGQPQGAHQASLWNL